MKYYEIDRPLLIENNKTIIGLMKDELGRQIMKKIIGLRSKTYSYLEGNNGESKKAKGTKKVCHKKRT